MSVVSQNVANPLVVSLRNMVQYLPVFINFSFILLVNNFISQLIFSILHIHISEAFYLLIDEKEVTVHWRLGHGVKCHYVYTVETTTTAATLTTESQSTALTPTTSSESSVSTVTTTPKTETTGTQGLINQ